MANIKKSITQTNVTNISMTKVYEKLGFEKITIIPNLILIGILHSSATVGCVVATFDLCKKRNNIRTQILV